MLSAIYHHCLRYAQKAVVGCSEVRPFIGTRFRYYVPMLIYRPNNMWVNKGKMLYRVCVMQYPMVIGYRNSTHPRCLRQEVLNTGPLFRCFLSIQY